MGPVPRGLSQLAPPAGFLTLLSCPLPEFPDSPQQQIHPLQRGVSASRPRYSVVSRRYSVESAPAEPAPAWCRAATAWSQRQSAFLNLGSARRVAEGATRTLHWRMAPTPPGGATRRQGNADLWPVLPVGAGTARRRRAAGRTPSWSRSATAWCRAATAWCRAATRISHTHGPKRTPGNRNLLTRKTVTREARIPTDLTACRMGDTDFQLVAVKEQVSQVRHHARWRRRLGSPHRENWPEVGVPLPARRSAWWHGRHAPVQRPRGAFCDAVSAPEYEKCGLQRGVSARRPGSSVESAPTDAAPAWSPHRQTPPERGVPVRRPRFSVESRGKSAGRDRWWAMQDLNLRLLPCEGSTLPLS